MRPSEKKKASIKAEESLKADQVEDFFPTEDLTKEMESGRLTIILLESRIIKLQENLQKVRLRIDANEKESPMIRFTKFHRYY